jgi:hypothetical protein
MDSEIKCTCPNCQQHIAAPPEMAGTTAECPNCDTLFVVPIPISVMTPQRETKQSKACPFCGEQILAVATKCKHCGEFLNGNTKSPSHTDQEWNLTPVSVTAEQAGLSQDKVQPEEDITKFFKILTAILVVVLCVIFIFAQQRHPTKTGHRATSPSDIRTGQVWRDENPYGGKNYRVIDVKDGYVQFYETLNEKEIDSEELAGTIISGSIQSEKISAFVSKKHLIQK